MFRSFPRQSIYILKTTKLQGFLNLFFTFQQETKDAMGINTYQFSLLYAWYSWPNVILPLVGGYMMDSVFGIRLGTIIFAGFIILGKFINVRIMSFRQGVDLLSNFD